MENGHVRLTGFHVLCQYLVPNWVQQRRHVDTIRTPSGSDACECDVTDWKALEIEFFEVYDFYRITVDSPWLLVPRLEFNDGDPPSGGICTEENKHNCVIIPPFPDDGHNYVQFVYAVTADSTAGPANVVFEAVDEGATCP